MTTIINEFATHVRGFMNSSLTHEQALANWCLGLAGEAGELNEVLYLIEQKTVDLDAAKKELGDLFWYFFALAEQLDFKVDQIHDVAYYDDRAYINKRIFSEDMIKTQVRSQCVLLSVNVGKVVDRIKKHLFHNKALDYDLLLNDLHEVYLNLLVFCHLLDMLHDDVMRANIDKLQKRHEGKTFNADVSNQNKLMEGLGDK